MQLRSVAELNSPNPTPLVNIALCAPTQHSRQVHRRFFLSRFPSSSSSFFFYGDLTTPPQRRVSPSCASHGGVVDDTCASSPSRASRSCSLITARRSLPARGHHSATMGTVVAWSVRILLGGLIATVRSVNSRVSA